MADPYSFVNVINANSVSDALSQGLRALQWRGVSEPSRNGPVLVAPAPVLTVYAHPMRRVLFSPMRDANPFFHLMESLWMLAGRNDLPWLAQFNKRMASYSDDGGLTQPAAYGYRWRNYFGYDQLPLIIAELRGNPTTRRCVLGMWDGGYSTDNGYDSSTGDLGGALRGSADVPCLAGDTLLWSPEGDRPIADVAKLFAAGAVKRWPVYAVNPATGEQKISWATKVWRSGRKATIAITYDDGSVMRVTPDHRLYLRTGPGGQCREALAGSLKPGDRVLATRRFMSRKGYEEIKKTLRANTAFANMQRTSRSFGKLLWRGLHDNEDVHHGNENKLDNRRANLQRISHGRHSSLNMFGDDNPMRRLSPSRHRIRAAKQSTALKANWAARRARDNHVVVSIEACKAEDVYDFTVPGFHTAVVGTGVVAHNCNTQCYFRIYDGRLDLTVTCRSNDIWWGAYGANAVHFSVLLEYVAAHVGVPIGRLYQFSNNYHLYTDVVTPSAALENDAELSDKYVGPLAIEPMPMIVDPVRWDGELTYFMTPPSPDIGDKYEEPFFAHVVLPMWWAWQSHKTKDYAKAGEYARSVYAADWRIACMEWLDRRARKHEGKL